jgi:L-serine dehydratase
MRLSSTFDLLGPVMVGPSSSHTAGALRIARVAGLLCAGPVSHVTFTLYNSFAQTYRGHGTDRALVAGMLGLAADDPRIRDAFDLAREQGLGWDFAVVASEPDLHPNTVDVEAACTDGTLTRVRGASVGGGRVRIDRVNGVDVSITGRMPTLIVEHRDVCGMLGAMTGLLGDEGVNIAFMSSYRTGPGGLAYAVFETDTPVSAPAVAALRAIPDVSAVHAVNIPGAAPAPAGFRSAYDFASAAELLAVCDVRGCSLGAAMRLRETDLRGANESAGLMGRVAQVMRDETAGPLAAPRRSLGGFIGGEAARVAGTLGTPTERLSGPVQTRAVAYALATLERSAAMGVIVAAPTAGSAGVVPGCVLALTQELGSDEKTLHDALYAAAAVGAVVEHGASVSGAQGGCQAEVGTASAMAAAAVAQLMGADPRTCLAAAGTALGNLLGLVCDPVGGLVEVPCQARNAAGVSNAFTAAHLALAGAALPLPFDEVVAAMRAVGDALPASLRETARGGLAACPSVCGAYAGC